jgi:hypothetical protein
MLTGIEMNVLVGLLMIMLALFHALSSVRFRMLEGIIPCFYALVACFFHTSAVVMILLHGDHSQALLADTAVKISAEVFDLLTVIQTAYIGGRLLQLRANGRK